MNLATISDWLVDRGLKDTTAARLAPIVAGAAALLAIAAIGGICLGGVKLWLHFHDKHVVSAAIDKGNADFRAKQITVERGAGDVKAKRDDANQADQAKLENKVDEADRTGGSAADDVWNNGLWSPPQD